MLRLNLLFVLLAPFVLCCCAKAPESLYYWKTTLNWTDLDTEKLQSAGVDRLGLRVFDWGKEGEEGPLIVRGGLPATLDVVPIAYITVARLEGWAAGPFDAEKAARELYERMKTTLAKAWSGSPKVWQLDADWTARTRAAWFAVVESFRALVHAQGARLEVTVRLHQYRDRQTQGVPPADAGVLMLYGVGDAVLDPSLVSGYLSGAAYPLPLTAAFPSYTQVRQINGYGKLVALHRLGAGAELPLADLKLLSKDRYEVLKRSSLGGRPLLAHDVLAIDRVDDETRRKVANLPAVARLIAASGGRVWFFDYDPGDNVPRLN